MSTYEKGKNCEICNVAIPDSYGNLMCDKCYDLDVKETKRVNEQMEEETKMEEVQEESAEDLKAQKRQSTTDLSKAYRDARNDGSIPVEPGEAGKPHTQAPDPSITEDNYKENPEVPDKPQVMSNLIQFVNSQHLLYPTTRSMYTAVKNYMIDKTQNHAQFSKHIWKPHAVDVGCGCGAGSNILSWESEFVWGIDKNWLSIEFAKEAFTREKNGIYYSSQVTFDQINILKENRDTMQFDIVVCIEVIEHINDYNLLLRRMIEMFSRKNKKGAYVTESEGSFYKGTDFFISTPNRNHPRISNDTPKNIYHVREWRSSEFVDIMEKYFEHVELLTITGKVIENPRETTHSPIRARCRVPRV